MLHVDQGRKNDTIRKVANGDVIHRVGERVAITGYPLYC
jgi:hypothetical protein